VDDAPPAEFGSSFEPRFLGTANDRSGRVDPPSRDAVRGQLVRGDGLRGDSLVLQQFARELGAGGAVLNTPASVITSDAFTFYEPKA